MPLEFRQIIQSFRQKTQNMSGGTKTRSKKMTEKTGKAGLAENDENTRDANDANKNEHGTDSASELSLKDISDQISCLRTQLNADLTSFKEDVKREMKEELTEFRQQINQQLATTMLTLQDHDKKLEEAAARIEELESWSAVVNEALQDTLKEERVLIDKINDLESRGRRNNLRIYGVREDTEGSSVITFVEKLLANEKLIQEGMEAQIQRAHRSLGPKRTPNAPPRSIVVNFLQYRVKESVLRNAWKKKIQLGDRILSFDHDYTTDVIQQRKAYKKVKSVLKENGIRFQTPYTRMRIHWESGSQIYNSAEDAERELRQRGFTSVGHSEEEEATTTGPSATRRLEQTSLWQPVHRRRGKESAIRARERLLEFQRKTTT